MDMKDTYNDRDLEAALKKLSASNFQRKLYDANYTSQQIGNTYTASVFFGIASLVHRQWEQLLNNEPQQSKTMVVFSYGSGALATMYQLQVYVYESDNHQLSFFPLSHHLEIIHKCVLPEIQAYAHSTNQIYD